MYEFFVISSNIVNRSMVSLDVLKLQILISSYERLKVFTEELFPLGLFVRKEKIFHRISWHTRFRV